MLGGFLIIVARAFIPRKYSSPEYADVEDVERRRPGRLMVMAALGPLACAEADLLVTCAAAGIGPEMAARSSGPGRQPLIEAPSGNPGPHL